MEAGVVTAARTIANSLVWYKLPILQAGTSLPILLLRVTTLNGAAIAATVTSGFHKLPLWNNATLPGHMTISHFESPI